MQMPNAPDNWGQLPFQEAIDAMVARGVILPDIYYSQEFQGMMRQLSFSVAGVMNFDQLTGVADSLKSYIANGGNFNDWKKEQSVLDLGLPKHRLDNIWRTNLQSQFNAGKWEQYNSVEGDLYLMFDAINDKRVRPSHAAMDGIIREKSDPFWNSHSPSLGYHCRCSLIPVTKNKAERLGGLTKQPILPNGEVAKADKGWDYPKHNRQAGINNAIQERKDKDAPKLLKDALDKVIAPKGVAVSNALSIPKSGYAKKPSVNILNIIDSIHSDGELPLIPIKSDGGNYNGVYLSRTMNGDAVGINLSRKNTTHPDLTLAHEIGHFIDHQAFGEKGVFSSIKSDIFAEWRDAVDNSNATKVINESKTSKKSYYLSKHEQWARSYAQYIATKSNQELLVSQLDNIRFNDRYPDYYRNSQWENEDFKPIMNAIDNLFLKMGWL